MKLIPAAIVLAGLIYAAPPLGVLALVGFIILMKKSHPSR